MRIANSKTKSPLKEKPLRNPGQSLDEQLDLIYEDLVPYFATGALSILVALLEWMQWLSFTPPQPIIATIFAALVCLFVFWKIRASLPKIRSIKQGRDGEKEVGQQLEELRVRGAKIFHDIVGNNFNLDHVVIDRTGIYVIETKTWSKPSRGKSTISYDGTCITKMSSPPDESPINQVKAARGWLHNLLKQSTGMSVQVKAIIVFPGWYVNRTRRINPSDVQVLNSKEIPKHIEKCKTVLSDEELNMCSFHLSQYIRNLSPSSDMGGELRWK